MGVISIPSIPPPNFPFTITSFKVKTAADTLVTSTLASEPTVMSAHLALSSSVNVAGIVAGIVVGIVALLLGIGACLLCRRNYAA